MYSRLLLVIFSLLNILFFGQIQADGKRGCMTGLLVTDAYNAVPRQEPARLYGKAPLLRDEACGLDTQILLGERINYIGSQVDSTGGQWAEIALLDQPQYQHGMWVGKTCFIKQQYCLPRVVGWVADARITTMLTPMYASKNIKSVKLGVLSMGTPIRVKNSSQHGWVEIELASGLTGNVDAADVATDRFLARVSVADKRHLVVVAMKRFKDTPYRWGGSSGFDVNNAAISGVDCSSLAYLAYKAIGLNIPRDAHDQLMASYPLKFGSDLQPGDCIFFAKINQEQLSVRVTHITLVVNENHLLETSGMRCYSNKEFKALSEFEKSQSGTRIVSPLECAWINKPLKDLWHGQLNDHGDMIFLGTFLGDEKTRKRLVKGLLS